MIYTLITQECIPVTLDDGMKYQITTTVTDAGELPDVFLFVHDIVETSDPKQDTFVRVGNPYDLENVVIGREAALAAGLTRYRTNMFVARYTDIELAVQAKQAISQRIDTAVNTWYTYKESFKEVPPLVPTDHPTTDEEYLQTLTNLYKDAIAARQAAEAAALAASETVKDSEAAAAAAAQIVSIYQKEVEFCQTARVTYWNGTPGVKSGVSALSSASQTFFNAGKAAYNTYNGMGDVYPVCTSAPLTWQYDLWTALRAMETALTGTNGWSTSEPYMAQLDTAFNTFCSGASTGYATAVADKNVKDLAVANAQTAKEKADASVATAQANEDAALAAIKAVCPTFDPSSV
jgi:hypothetical protein